jgi:hypothetical protein
MLYRVHQQIDDQLTQTVTVPVAGKISVKNISIFACGKEALTSINTRNGVVLDRTRRSDHTRARAFLS